MKLLNNYLGLYCRIKKRLPLFLICTIILTQQINLFKANHFVTNNLNLSYIINTFNSNNIDKIYCVIPNENELGECLSIGLCEPYLQLRNLKDNLTSQNINFMKRVQCENKTVVFNDNLSNFNLENWIPHVCCPIRNKYKRSDDGFQFDNVSYLNPVINFTKPIVKPRILVGNEMLSELSTEINSTKKTLKHLTPKLSDRVQYSTSTITTGTNTNNNTNKENSSKMITNASSTITEIETVYEECGRQITNRIYGGEIAELDEYPWLALIFYNSDEFGCSGSLINHNFVLTAAHCVTGSVVRKKNGLKLVRLGEFNVNSQPDCIEEENYLSCADAAIDVAIDKIFVHPYYKEDSPFKSDDIALIRLKDYVSFTHFIMPICLPKFSEENLEDPFQEGKYFSVSGWGRTDLFNSYFPNIRSPIKLKLQVPYVSNENCSEILKEHGAEITDKQICAGGELSKDTCAGDSGGPLMYFDKNVFRWIAYGIVSYGFSQCGLAGHPAVYTNVTEYVDWINSVMHSKT